MAVTDGASAFSAAPASATSAFYCAVCSHWKFWIHCSGAESILQYPFKAVRAYDLKIVVLTFGISSINPHSSGNNSTNPFTGPFAHTVP